MVENEMLDVFSSEKHKMKAENNLPYPRRSGGLMVVVEGQGEEGQTSVLQSS